jgi:hypothetical protein
MCIVCKFLYARMQISQVDMRGKFLLDRRGRDQ